MDRHAVDCTQQSIRNENNNTKISSTTRRTRQDKMSEAKTSTNSILKATAADVIKHLANSSIAKLEEKKKALRELLSVKEQLLSKAKMGNVADSIVDTFLSGIPSSLAELNNSKFTGSRVASALYCANTFLCFIQQVSGSASWSRSLRESVEEVAVLV